MNEPKKVPLIQVLAGVTFLVIGLAVFVVRLQHAGAYALPSAGVLLGGLLALLIGGLLIWAKTPGMIKWIALVVSPVAIFPAVYSIVAELEEVISLSALDSGGAWLISGFGSSIEKMVHGLGCRVRKQ